MGIFLNPKFVYNNFDESINTDTYIDKTDFIEEINSLIKTKNKYLCVSRPRRFGKTTTVEMLAAYYTKSLNSGGLFSGLKMSMCDSYKKHLNKYNVVYINMLDCLDDVGRDAQKIESRITKCLLRDLNSEFSYSIPQDFTLRDVFQDLKENHEQDFIFIIDEWDCLFRELPNDKKAQTEYLNFLRWLFKDKDYVALVYMTGILPIKKYGTQSALNMFVERSIMNMSSLASFTGFTENEVRILCDKFNSDFSKMQEWYDGYTIEGEHIYNPTAVVSAINSKKFKSYWTQTETYEVLEKYINMNFDGLKEIIINLIAGAKYPVNTEVFANDMTTINSKDDVLTLLVHLGYLGYNDEEVFIPNKEIKMSFQNSVSSLNWNI